MIVLKGTHGTSVSNSEGIESDGFRKTNGLRGRGVYFWKDGPYSKLLARESYQHKLSSGGFAGQVDMSYAAVLVDIRSPKDGFVDFTNGEWRGYLESYFANIARLPTGDRRNVVSAAYNLFFYKLKQKVEFELTVVCLFVPSPEGRKGKYPVDVLGHPCCYVAMDEGAIKIREVLK